MININREKILHKFSNIFARLHYKINFDITNTSSFLLATDLLRDNTKYQLFKIVTVNVENVFCQLLNEDKKLSAKKGEAIFYSLIKKTTQEFLMIYYGYKMDIQPNIIKNSFYTQLLLNDEKILLRVPLQILLNEESELFRSIFVPVYNKAYDNFIEALLDNLIVEISNAVMFIIINEFSFIYDIRRNFYRSNFLSLRNVERFRNNLSWQSRIRKFIKQPADMYNSQQGIWILRTTGIYYRIIYANRSLELMNLKKFSLLTLFAIETKDFLSSRFDEFFYVCGNSIRYVLTSVVGQIFGLIWRGIIEGLKK